jgi:hypothetical protein
MSNYEVGEMCELQCYHLEEKIPLPLGGGPNAEGGM